MVGRHIPTREALFPPWALSRVKAGFSSFPLGSREVLARFSLFSLSEQEVLARFSLSSLSEQGGLCPF